MTRGALVTAGRNAFLNITVGAAGGPQSDRSLAGTPEDLIRGALDGQADANTMQRRPGYVIDLGINYRGTL